MTSDVSMMTEVLVRVKDSYERKEVIGGISISLNNVGNNVKNTVRFGEVLSVPILYELDIKVGDIIYFHHNVTREPQKLTNDYDYNHGQYDYDRFDDLFRVPPTLMYAIERDGKIMALSPFCYIKPFDKEGFGIIKYGNKSLEDRGYKEGDKIIYSKDSDYVFKIKNEVLFRMQSDWIIGKFN